MRVRRVAERAPGAGPGRPTWAVATPAVLLAILLVPSPPSGGSHGVSPPPPGSYALYPPTPSPSSVPIQHIVIAMQENHAYDNYFGTYCQSFSQYCLYVGNGTPPNACLPINLSNPAAGCDKPFHFSNATPMKGDIVHNEAATLTAWNNGSMNGFIVSERDGRIPVGYYNWKQIGNYWELAEQYALGDDFFSSARSYSLANHWYLLAGAAPAEGVSEYVGDGRYQPNWSTQQTYLNESNLTPAIDDELVNSSVSWTYYDFALPPTYNGSIRGGQAFSYWNPLAAKAESYESNLTPHFVSSQQFFKDARNGNLPNVSWVIPTIPNSEHPPYNVTTGEQWVTNVTNAVEQSPEWNSTALFITWDEYGGFYDSVDPPGNLSFRVPLLIVSPYVREDYIDHAFGDFDSLLRLVEWRNGLASLTRADATAPLPLDAFDFSATPRAPITLGPAQGAPYPILPQGLAAPGPVTNLSVTPMTGGLTLRWDPPVGGSPVSFYKLDYFASGSTVTTQLRVDGAADGYVLEGLSNGTTYYVTIQADAGPANLSAGRTAHGTTVAPAPGVVGPYGVPNAADPTMTVYLARPTTTFDPLAEAGGARRAARSATAAGSTGRGPGA